MRPSRERRLEFFSFPERITPFARRLPTPSAIGGRGSSEPICFGERRTLFSGTCDGIRRRTPNSAGGFDGGHPSGVETFRRIERAAEKNGGPIQDRCSPFDMFRSRISRAK